MHHVPGVGPPTQPWLGWGGPSFLSCPSEGGPPSHLNLLPRTGGGHFLLPVRVHHGIRVPLPLWTESQTAVQTLPSIVLRTWSVKMYTSFWGGRREIQECREISWWNDTWKLHWAAVISQGKRSGRRVLSEPSFFHSTTSSCCHCKVRSTFPTDRCYIELDGKNIIHRALSFPLFQGYPRFETNKARRHDRTISQLFACCASY